MMNEDDKSSIYNIHLCRICQNPKKLDLIDTSDTSGSEDGTPCWETLKYIFCEIIWVEDRLLSLICRACMKNAYETARFKKLCLETNIKRDKFNNIYIELVNEPINDIIKENFKKDKKPAQIEEVILPNAPMFIKSEVIDDVDVLTTPPHFIHQKLVIVKEREIKKTVQKESASKGDAIKAIKAPQGKRPIEDTLSAVPSEKVKKLRKDSSASVPNNVTIISSKLSEYLPSQIPRNNETMCKICQGLFSTINDLRDHIVSHHSMIPRNMSEDRVTRKRRMDRERQQFLRKRRLTTESKQQAEARRLQHAKVQRISLQSQSPQQVKARRAANAESQRRRLQKKMPKEAAEARRAANAASQRQEQLSEVAVARPDDNAASQRRIGRYRCEYCHIGFYTLDEFQCHYKESNHKNFLPLQCPKCGCKTIRRADQNVTAMQCHCPFTHIDEAFEKRKSVDNRNRKILCMHCNSCFATLRLAKEHVAREHVAIRPFNCSKCNGSFLSKKLLDEHNIANHHVRCNLCPQSFDSMELWQKHRKQDHDNFASNNLVSKPINQPQGFHCILCKRMFPTRFRLANHIESQECQQYGTCILCGTTFHGSNITRHLEMNHNIDPHDNNFAKYFKCQTSTPPNTNKQQTNEPRRQCEQYRECNLCGKYLHVSQIRTHLIYTHHVNVNEKGFKLRPFFKSKVQTDINEVQNVRLYTRNRRHEEHTYSRKFLEDLS